MDYYDLFPNDPTGEDWVEDEPEAPVDHYEQYLHKGRQGSHTPWSDPKSNPMDDVKRFAADMRSGSSTNWNISGSFVGTYTINSEGHLVPVATTASGTGAVRSVDFRPKLEEPGPDEPLAGVM